MMKNLLSTFAVVVCSTVTVMSPIAAHAQQVPAIMPTFVNCGDPGKSDQYWLTDAHAKMIDALNKTVAALQNEADPQAHRILGDAFAEFFKGSIDSTDWLTVKNMILQVAPHIINETVYQCADTQKVLFCQISGAPAFTPTSREKTILCKPSLTRVDLLSGVVMHESMHRWGGKDIDYIGELYCADWQDKQPDTKRLVRTPDAYMMFIYQVAQNGQRFPWYPCYAKSLKSLTK